MPSKHIVNEAFAQRPDLRQMVLDAIAKAPEYENLFGDIAHYIQDVRQASSQPLESQDDLPSKKRKLEHCPSDLKGWNKENICEVAEVSFSVPQRKKLKLCISKSASAGLRAVHSLGRPVFGVNWDCVCDIVCLPVPEKAQAQYNFCVLSATTDELVTDQIVWTVPDSVPKDGIVVGLNPHPGETYRTLLISILNEALKPHKKRVIEPEKKQFSSQVVQAHLKGEPAYHIKAFRGSKDGFLFLLSNGIFWGFKKPLEFLSFDTIESVSYTSILQRTFNLNITALAATEGGPQEYEFSMIDQADFAGIDEYVKRHELQDASMAEQRRAKKLNVNGIKGDEAKQEGDGEEEEGELEKARREAEDLEDEEEDDENFDPGSEGESEGSGSDSEEDDDEHDGRAGSNMADEELESEAESAEE